SYPELCHWIGIGIVLTEFAMPFLLFWRRTRISAIYLGIVFHITLILTMDVPAIFFFLFPAQLLLFINSENILRWIEMKRDYNARAPRPKLVFDGNCGFCRESLRKLRVMDLYNTLEPVDFQTHPDLALLHPELTKEKAKSQMYLVESDGNL